ncbi:MAG: cytochrome c [Campylobacterales bacterium]|nr:cytochrome c [Campylobacterales bacterium]
MQKGIMVAWMFVGLIEASENNESITDNNISQINAQHLYKKCAGCHGSDGKTLALNKSPIIAGSDKNATLTKLQGYQKGDLDKQGMGRLMFVQVDGLKPNELEALAGYIATMER